MNTPAIEAPPLAPPGAGLPFPEAWMARMMGRFMLRRWFTWDSALGDIEATAERMITRFSELSPEAQATPVLVKRLRGLEDSSRFWSPSMVLEHLCITGGGMLMMVLMLSHGKTPKREVRTADMKPTGKPPAEVLATFTELHRGVRVRVRDGAGPQREHPKHKHPWFGPLNAADWLRLMAAHLRLHERQMGLILAGLEAAVGFGSV